MTIDMLLEGLQREKVSLLRNCREGECSTYGFGLCQSCRESERLVTRIDVIRSLKDKFEKAEAWRLAVEDAMIVWDMLPSDNETPRQSLHRLLCHEQQIALDPSVSSAAAQLVASTRANAIEECKQAILSFLEVKNESN